MTRSEREALMRQPRRSGYWETVLKGETVVEAEEIREAVKWARHVACSSYSHGVVALTMLADAAEAHAQYLQPAVRGSDAGVPPLRSGGTEATPTASIIERLGRDVFYGDNRLERLSDHNPLHLDAISEIERLQADKDGAYLERNQVVAALASLFPSGIARTDIPGWAPEWHRCVYIDLPTGQASWHYHDNQHHLFAHLPTYAGKWDGHTTAEKYARLAKLPSTLPEPVCKTKTEQAEMWHVEWVFQHTGDAAREPKVSVHWTETSARQEARKLSGHPYNNGQWSCIKVTGPHKHELPA